MSPTAFRCLVLASFALQLGSAFVDALLQSLIPSALSRAVEAEPLPAVFDRSWLVALMASWAAALLAATIGLLFFKRWARALGLWGTLVGFGFYSAVGTGISSGVASALSEASSVSWGAALAIAFFSPLRERFAPANNGG